MHFRCLSPETRSLSLTTPPCFPPRPRRVRSNSLFGATIRRIPFRGSRCAQREGWRRAPGVFSRSSQASASQG
eukprot:1731853-Prymnesium_polylepis.1